MDIDVLVVEELVAALAVVVKDDEESRASAAVVAAAAAVAAFLARCEGDDNENDDGETALAAATRGASPTLEEGEKVDLSTLTLAVTAVPFDGGSRSSSGAKFIASEEASVDMAKTGEGGGA